MATSSPEDQCQWFALCSRPATMLVRHPVLDPVPTCDRCVARMGLEGDVVGPVAATASPGA